MASLNGGNLAALKGSKIFILERREICKWKFSAWKEEVWNVENYLLGKEKI